MLSASVSNIDIYRSWLGDEELDLGWILNRLLAPFEQTPAMKAGEAFHKALEFADSDSTTLTANGYTFEIECECALSLPRVRELSIAKPYGELMVRGRVDGLTGNLVIDYKTTSQFDPDRLMNGYQWRFYMDMLEAAEFLWNVFVFRETDDPMTYRVTDFHSLTQKRYPELAADCMKLAHSYYDFASKHLVAQRSCLAQMGKGER